MAASDSAAETDRRVLCLSENDNVAVVIAAIRAGETIRVQGNVLVVPTSVSMGHKIAIRAIAAGEKVVKYGAPIGSATRAIAAGEHVHTHNLKSDYLPTLTRDGHNPSVETS